MFISESSLQSEWVKREIFTAKAKLESKISKIYPIIIDNKITYKDERIPDWIRERYNLKPVQRPRLAATRIHQKLRELSWSKHPDIKKRQNLFVGRNDKLEEFEERIDDHDKNKPSCIVASGISGVGRRTFF